MSIEDRTNARFSIGESKTNRKPIHPRNMQPTSIAFKRPTSESAQPRKYATANIALARGSLVTEKSAFSSFWVRCVSPDFL